MNVTSSQLQNARGQLDQTKQALNKTQEQLQSEQQLSAAQKQQLADLEAKLKDARDTIAKIAAVKDDDRGMVITLQGEVLFKTGKWDLKAGAMAKLDQIADALQRQRAADRRLRLHRQRRHASTSTWISRRSGPSRCATTS